MRWIVLVLLMVGFVSAVDIDFDCPDEIFVDEEFECSLEVFDGDGVYDVKVELDEERDSVLKAWNDGEWKSGYYYLREFVEDGKEVDVRLKVLKVGGFDGILKLRQGDDREFFEIEIEISRSEIVGDSHFNEGGSALQGDSSTLSKGDSSLRDGDLESGVVVLGSEPEVAVLNGVVVYESRDSRIVNNLSYGFCVFLIFVVGVLVWERF